MPPHVIDNMIVLRFLDGDQMVPFWWGNLAAFRQGPEHGDFAPPLPYTLAEAREQVNKELERNAIGAVMRDWIAEARVRF